MCGYAHLLRTITRQNGCLFEGAAPKTDYWGGLFHFLDADTVLVHMK